MVDNVLGILYSAAPYHDFVSFMKPALKPQERLIFALDVPDISAAEGYVRQLQGLVSFYKVGWELFLASGLRFVEDLRKQGFQVFLDLKLTPDIPEQLKRSAHRLASAGIEFITVHGNGKTIRMVKDGIGDLPLKILSLTVLTSMDYQDMRDLYITGRDKEFSMKFKNVEDYVLCRAEESLENGADGLIASGLHAARLRQTFGKDFWLVCPGIRPVGESHHDHKRAATPTQAISGGADYIVVGRPIKNATNPREMAEKIIREILDASNRTVQHV